MLITNSPKPQIVVKDFSQVQTDLTRLDASLTQWEKSHDSPGPGVQDDFRSIATRMDDASLDLRELHPEEKDHLKSLKRDILHVAINGGNVQCMTDKHITFGSGWGKTLDASIADTQTSVDLANEPASGIPVELPNPLQTIRQLSDLQADLASMDARLTEWANNGHIYPNQKVVDQMNDLASRLFDARGAMRDLHPEQAELVNGLKGDLLDVAVGCGRTQTMAQHNYIFTSGWSSTLDKSIQDVHLAIDVMLTP